MSVPLKLLNDRNLTKIVRIYLHMNHSRHYYPHIHNFDPYIHKSALRLVLMLHIFSRIPRVVIFDEFSIKDSPARPLVSR